MEEVVGVDLSSCEVAGKVAGKSARARCLMATALSIVSPGGDHPGTAPVAGSSIHVVPWDDPVDVSGFDPRSRYAELFWLPVIGPSGAWLLRRLADELELSPEGVWLDAGEVARAIGIGGREGRRSTLDHALERCGRFGCVRRAGAGTVAVRRRLAMVPDHQLRRLPGSLQLLHRTWEHCEGDATEQRRRSDLYAAGDELPA